MKDNRFFWKKNPILNTTFSVIQGVEILIFCLESRMKWNKQAFKYNISKCRQMDRDSQKSIRAKNKICHKHLWTIIAEIKGLVKN